MKTVFILGAGASTDAGPPIMSNFLDRADALIRPANSLVNESREAFIDIFNVIADLQGVYSKSFLDLDNIETIFSAIEMGQIIGKLGQEKKPSFKRLNESIITLIVKTLEFSIEFPE